MKINKNKTKITVCGEKDQTKFEIKISPILGIKLTNLVILVAQLQKMEAVSGTARLKWYLINGRHISQ